MKLDALAALFAAVFTVAACWGAGTLLIERIGAKLARAEKFPLAFLLGASLVHLFVFAAMALHVAYKPVWVIAFTALIIAAAWRSAAGALGLAAALWERQQSSPKPVQVVTP